MLPVLIDLPFIKLYTFGVFLLLAFFWSTFLLWKNFLLTAYKEEDVFDVVFLGIFGGLLVSRVIHIALHFSEFGWSIAKFVLINGYPGLSLYGFVLGFIGTAYVTIQRSKLRFQEAVDYFVPSAFIALAFGKIGAFFSGVEMGSKTNFLLKMKYVGAEGFRHLTPLYEGVFFFIGAIIANQLLFAIRREKYSKGVNLAFFLWYLGLVFSGGSLLKDHQDALFQNLSFNALLSYVLLLTFSAYFIYYFRSSFAQYGKSIFKGFHKKAQRASRK